VELWWSLTIADPVGGHNVVKVKEARKAWGNPGFVRLLSELGFHGFGEDGQDWMVAALPCCLIRDGSVCGRGGSRAGMPRATWGGGGELG
jgi:hypothetical protein